MGSAESHHESCSIEESQEFKNQHLGVDFPVGFADLTLGASVSEVLEAHMDF